MNQQDVQLQQQDNQPNNRGADGGRGNGNGGRRGGNWVKPNNIPPPPPQPCPRCGSWNTKFCYYNNYKLVQLRYFCKDCKRNWTHGGALRNIPVGGNRKSNIPKTSMALASSSSGSLPPPAVFPPLPESQVSYELPPLPATNLGGGNNMLFSGSESGAGFFLPNFASTIQGGMIQPSTVLPNMGLVHMPSYQVPQHNPFNNLFTTRDTGGPAGERNLGVGPLPPLPTAQPLQDNNDDDDDQTAKWLEFMKNKKA